MTPAQRLERVIAAATIGIPPVGLVAAIAHGATPTDLGLCAGLYVLTMLGITAGYHRHFTHKGYRAHPAVRVALGLLGSMAAQGPILYWAAAHRAHHQHADRPGDPHSPVQGGFWHAHVGWMLVPPPPDWVRVVPDLLKDDLAMALHQRYFVAVGLGLAAPAVVGGLVGGTLDGALGGFLWGGLARVALVHQATWLVNSWCHMFGNRAHDTADQSTNSWACAVLTLGEGWHNNHHAAPVAARHGRFWWQPDPTYGVIRMLAALGLATQVVEVGRET